MATATEIITDSLQELLVQADEQSMSAANMQSAIRYLNRMMGEWAVQGMPLGFTNITSGSDALTVSDGALSAIVSNLAVRLAPQFDRNVSIELAAASKSGMNAVRHLTVSTSKTNMPSTMPIGSGNEGYYHNNYRHFYPDTPDETVDSESDRAITQEDNT